MQWSGLGALLIALLILVVFVLPLLVEKPELETDQPQAKLEEAPWQDAQQAKHRKLAQATLEKLLAAQNNLEGKQVERWAAADFAEANQLAVAGDEAYQNTDFIRADELYKQALADMEGLLQRSETLLADKLVEGNQAIDRADAPAALAAFELAVAIEPTNEAATAGLQRAQQLEPVLNLIKAAEMARAELRLQEAQAGYEQALALDPLYQPAQQGLAAVKQQILDIQFEQAMSTGYSHLSEQQFNRARQAFQQALKLKPDAAVAVEGRQQAIAGGINAKLNKHKRAAETYANKEQWQQALTSYEAALKVDPSVDFAKQGAALSRTRLRLDETLQGYLKHPERLSADAVFGEAQQVLAIADKVSNPGPRLQQQQSRLGELLAVARQPVKVMFSSDQSTQVTLQRVGDLGQFASLQRTLLPGRYVAVGKRLGYRDVRREFVIAPGQQPAAVEVVCTEKI